MTMPVTNAEINSPDLERSATIMSDVFGWQPRSFARPDCLVAAAGDGPGVDTALLPSVDGAPRAIPIIRVLSLAAVRSTIEQHGGTVVVEPFVVAGVGRGCHLLDPTGVLQRLHDYDPDAQLARVGGR